MYQIDPIRHTSPRSSSIPVEFSRWKEKNNLYHLISRHCNRPAYFWFNYLWSIPTEEGRVLLNSSDSVDQGWIFEIYREIVWGTVNPQAWCDSN